MTKFVYDKTSKIVIRQTTDEVNLGEDEEVVENPTIADGVDFTKKLIVDNGVVRNPNKQEQDAHKAARRERAKTRIRQRAQKGYATDANLFTKAFCKMCYDQLIRLKEGLPLESLETMQGHIDEIVENWQEDIPRKSRAREYEIEVNDATLTAIKKEAKKYQDVKTSKYLMSKACAKVFYGQLVKFQAGEPLDSFEEVFSTQVEEIIKNWNEFDETAVEKLTK